MCSLSFDGRIEDGKPLCGALNELSSLRHLSLPRFSGQQDLLELVKPTKLTKLHTLCMPHLTLSTVLWVVAQTELVELVTHVEGGPSKKLQGLFGKLSACSSLRSLYVSFNVVQVDAFDGLEALPITRLRVSGSTTPDGQAGMAKLLGACPSVDVLMYCMLVFRADDVRSYSEQIWASIGALDNLGTLALYLPDHKRCRSLVGDLPNLEVLYDTHKSSVWTREWVDALCTARKLKIVVKMGLKDDLYDAFAAKAPGVTVLRDVD
jgi:hypothetical protein